MDSVREQEGIELAMPCFFRALSLDITLSAKGSFEKSSANG